MGDHWNATKAHCCPFHCCPSLCCPFLCCPFLSFLPTSRCLSHTLPSSVHNSRITPHLLPNLSTPPLPYPPGDDVRVTLSFVEIYNEKIRDLLTPSDIPPQPTSSTQPTHPAHPAHPLRVREHPVIGPYIEGVSKYTVNGDLDRALRLLSSGLSRRTMSPSAWNAHSSRSHAVVTVEISQGTDKIHTTKSIALKGNLGSPTHSFTHSTAPPSDQPRYDDIDSDRHYVRLQVVDLAGSEKDPMHPSTVRRAEDELEMLVSSSLSYTPAPAAATVTEMRTIRRSLSTLGYIIRELSKGEAAKSLPYRDSLLTWLLKDALSGR